MRVLVSAITVFSLVAANLAPAVARQLPGRGELTAGDPATVNVKARTRLRKEASETGVTFCFLEKGERVKVLGTSGVWMKVQSRWVSGKPVVGFVTAADLNVSTKKPAATAPVLEIKNEIGAQSTPSKASMRTVEIIAPEPTTNPRIESLLAARDMALAEVKALKVENSRLNAEVARHPEEMKAIRASLANADLKLRTAEDERQKLAEELKKVKENLATALAQLQLPGGQWQLFRLADSGEAVLFKGIGEARMASKNGRTALRFPITDAGKAEQIFISARAERHLQGEFIYFVVDSKLLAF